MNQWEIIAAGAALEPLLTSDFDFVKRVLIEDPSQITSGTTNGGDELPGEASVAVIDTDTLEITATTQCDAILLITDTYSKD